MSTKGTVTLPALPNNMTNSWVIYSTPNHSVLFSTTNSNSYSVFPSKYSSSFNLTTGMWDGLPKIEDHPWLDNFADMCKMLEGKLELPHSIKLKGSHRKQKKLIEREQKGLIKPRCSTCLDAAHKRREYQRKKKRFLLEENVNQL